MEQVIIVDKRHKPTEWGGCDDEQITQTSTMQAVVMMNKSHKPAQCRRLWWWTDHINQHNAGGCDGEQITQTSTTQGAWWWTDPKPAQWRGYGDEEITQTSTMQGVVKMNKSHKPAQCWELWRWINLRWPRATIDQRLWQQETIRVVCKYYL